MNINNADNVLLNDSVTHPEGSGILCPALVISAPSSGSGKTTVTAALARYHRNQGKKVTVFKVGPDFIDPMILQQASGELVYQLDLWIVGKKQCRELLYQAAQSADLILIEGVMGLFDGTPSSADIATYFNIPVLAVIDAAAMAQTFAAVTFGLAKYKQNLPFAGVIANKVSSDRHIEILEASLDSQFTLFGRLPNEAAITLPERHLGLVQAQELQEIDSQLDTAAAYIAKTKLVNLPPSVEFYTEAKVDNDGLLNLNDETPTTNEKALANTRIAIVKDQAFNFIYAANIEFLEQAGATILYCSALNDTVLPECDALYLPGGYPELYAQQLSNNVAFISAIRTFAQSNKPIIAECGGMLYLLEHLTDFNQQQFEMVGLLPGTAVMNKRLTAIGSQSASLPCFGSSTTNDGHDNNNNEIIMRGHSFHYSSAKISLTPVSQARHFPSQRLGEYVYQHGNIIASYMHWYLPSNPALAIKLFQKAASTNHNI
ncbi:hydrogenobyrinate a,c-diamide synthase [Psychromonas marina]|uniref:Hydrogenobyrinate a,c-diamide synthase n=1 Tax=Psychromonas marina TaxID=88364 RepID=A0ABQ6DYU4_9GAMM|nr:cobyrinate a,c-diamide synthase [Psychromonas marina]GLS90318.1 hydrogenobyrinate a,c-diamide synthase [Psychromonas marina]